MQMKKTFSAATPISVVLGLLGISVVMVTRTLGIFPDPIAIKKSKRIDLCESIAINCSLLAGRNDFRAVEANLEAMVERYDYILSAGLRRRTGSLQLEVGDHRAHWTPGATNYADASCIYVPITADKRL